MTPATIGLYEAVVNGTVTHSGDPRLARHVANATVRTDNRGTRIYKKHSAQRIDLAVCAIMAHSVAATVDPGVQLYWYEASRGSLNRSSLIIVRIRATAATISRGGPAQRGGAGPPTTRDSC
jgi:hypothetical protein